MLNPSKELIKKMELQTNKELIAQYLAFKQFCIEQKIININEIIKLFEVWLHL